MNPYRDPTTGRYVTKAQLAEATDYLFPDFVFMLHEDSVRKFTKGYEMPSPEEQLAKTLQIKPFTRAEVASFQLEDRIDSGPS